MDIRDQINKFDALIDFVENELPSFAENILAIDLIALVTNRVVQKGENYLGGSFSPYSTTTVAAWRFWGKSRNQTAEKKVRAISRARGALTYTEFRTLNKLKTNKKNFEFTGEMWRKFGIVKATKTVIQIGGTTSVAQQKIDDNSEREGLSIIEANFDEITLARSSALDWLTDQANRILNE